MTAAPSGDGRPWSKCPMVRRTSGKPAGRGEYTQYIAGITRPPTRGRVFEIAFHSETGTPLQRIRSCATNLQRKCNESGSSGKRGVYFRSDDGISNGAGPRLGTHGSRGVFGRSGSFGIDGKSGTGFCTGGRSGAGFWIGDSSGAGRASKSLAFGINFGGSDVCLRAGAAGLTRYATGRRPESGITTIDVG